MTNTRGMFQLSPIIAVLLTVFLTEKQFKITIGLFIIVLVIRALNVLSDGWSPFYHHLEISYKLRTVMEYLFKWYDPSTILVIIFIGFNFLLGIVLFFYKNNIKLEDE